MEILNLVVMILVGALSGTLAAKIMKSDVSLVISAVLGIAGAVVGGFIFNLLRLTPGKGISKALSTTFGVELPTNIIGMVVSATVGAIIILFVVKLLRGKMKR
jgi:uncharacterized membrane protein YeaQ/YmgE (transglycosylase-associated protein family)